MTMKSLFMFYVVLLLVSFSVIHINHALELAHEENGAIQERALIPRLNYTVTHARKLLLLPDIGDGDDDGTGNFGDVGNGSVGGGVGNGSVGGGGVDNGGGNAGSVGDGNGGDNGTGGGDGDGDGSENRMGPGLCSKNNIQVNQGATSPLPSGIPTYTVIIENACYSESCSISNIHLNCGWFSSARLINPKVFRRLDYDDCLVNDGQPLTAGQSLTFIYANSFPYKLSVASIAC